MDNSPQKNTWIDLIRQFDINKEVDLSRYSIKQGLVLLSIPMIAEMFMEGLFAIVDIYFVSRISTAAVSAVGITESLMMLLYSVAIGIATAASAFIARRIGEGDTKSAGEMVALSIVMVCGLSLFIALPAVIWTDDILVMMGATDEMMLLGRDYFRWLFATNVIILLLFLINGVFRSAGTPYYAMRVLAIANGLNILLDPLFIFGLGPIPAMGLEGAAIASVIGRSVGIIYQVYYLMRKQQVIPTSTIRWRYDAEKMKLLIVKSAGGAGQYLIETVSWVALMRIAAMFGQSAMAAYTIVFRIIAFSILPIWGVVTAVATMVGQYLGMKRPSDAKSAVHLAGKANTIYLVLISCVFYISAYHMVSIFDDSSDVINMAIQGIHILCIGYVAFGIAMVLQQAFNGAGDTQTPTYVSFFGYVLIEIPVAYLLAITFDLGLAGVFWAITICHSFVALIFYLLYRRGRWLKTKI